MGMSVVARQFSPDRISSTFANMKRCTFVSLALLSAAVSVMAAPQDKKSDIGVKAPSPYENCNCQCHHYTWQDTYGKIQGTARAQTAREAAGATLRVTLAMTSSTPRTAGTSTAS